jgi:hypothetical protein
MRDRNRRRRKVKRDPSRRPPTVQVKSGKLVAVVAVTDSPVAEMCLRTFPSLCDAIYVQFDPFTGTQEFLRHLRRNQQSIFGGKLRMLRTAKRKWTMGMWHEDLLEMVRGANASMIFTPGQDETYQVKPFRADVQRLVQSPANALMFTYSDMATDDGRVIPFRYPGKPHMKVYKWKSGLSYKPYSGCGQVAKYAHPSVQIRSTTGIKHWCFYTKEMEEKKIRWLKKHYDFESVIRRR